MIVSQRVAVQAGSVVEMSSDPVEPFLRHCYLYECIGTVPESTLLFSTYCKSEIRVLYGM